MKRFRVLSDLHMDINEKYPFSVSDPDTFTVVAGDTSGLPYLVNVKCDSVDSRVIEVTNDTRLGDFFGGRTRATVTVAADGRTATYRGREFPTEAAGFSVMQSPSPVSESFKVTFSITSAEGWLRKNVRRGVIVAGNHLVYNRDGYSIEGLKRRLAEKFPLGSDMTFLDETVGTVSKEVDGILFVGSTLYTDYRLPTGGRERDVDRLVELNKRVATPRMSGGGLNDFNFGRTEECAYPNGGTEPNSDGLFWLTPTNYERFFQRSLEAIGKAVENNPDKDVVVVTHHCPSPKCISERYVNSELNASYVSDLEDFILSHPNIRCWVCGHVHHRAEFRVGGCLVVMNPLGYCKYGEYTAEDGSVQWTPDTFVDTETWTVERKPFDTARWDRTREEAERKRMEMLSKYGGFFL